MLHLKEFQVAARAVCVLAGVGLVYWVWQNVQESEFRKPEAPQIVTLTDPRDRDEPPEDELQEPEPVPEEEFESFEEVVTETPQLEDLPEIENLDVVGDALGLEGDGVAGADAFGLLAKRGGRDLLRTAGRRSSLVAYGRVIERHFQEALADRDDLLRRNYSVLIMLWLAPDGRVERSELAEASGTPEVDALLREALGKIALVRPPPPAEMPQPIRLRITTRGARGA